MSIISHIPASRPSLSSQGSDIAKFRQCGIPVKVRRQEEEEEEEQEEEEEEEEVFASPFREGEAGERACCTWSSAVQLPWP